MAMSMPANFQRSSSAIFVPDLSPRDMNAEAVRLIAASAARISLDPLTAAGSLLGPTRIKSLYITG